MNNPFFGTQLPPPPQSTKGQHRRRYWKRQKENNKKTEALLKKKRAEPAVFFASNNRWFEPLHRKTGESRWTGQPPCKKNIGPTSRQQGQHMATAVFGAILLCRCWKVDRMVGELETGEQGPFVCRKTANADRKIEPWLSWNFLLRCGCVHNSYQILLVFISNTQRRGVCRFAGSPASPAFGKPGKSTNVFFCKPVDRVS